MATQQDLQELLRLLTTGRKLPMMQAMGQIKALQAKDLRSIKQIAEAPLSTVKSAVGDEKQAKSLQTACKSALAKGGPAGGKRAAAGGSSSSAAPPKRAKISGSDDFMTGPVELTPEELESALELPLCLDESRIAQTALWTNRAPLVLAFAVELLRYTMPEQPPSSRLSLAQAVVSANSRSKAVSIGLDKGPSADEEGWAHGQPRVRVLGRDIPVLKRGGYEWKGEETAGGGDEPQTQDAIGKTTTESLSALPANNNNNAAYANAWSTSQSLSLRQSTFIARATSITEPSQRETLLRSLLDEKPELKTATHNAWAYRIRSRDGGAPAIRIREGSFDDGETGCGDLMLRIMREADATDCMVVLTRWFGGIMLGPDRWRLMRSCVTGALAGRLRKRGTEVTIGGEAVWGLDLEDMKSKSMASGFGSGARRQDATGPVGMQIHTPENARNYLLKSFATAPSPSEDAEASLARENEATGGGGSPEKGKGLSGKESKASKKTLKAQSSEKEENLGLLLGALRLLFDSWADHLLPADLDRRAWSWYVAVRPEIESGPSGWGAKGALRLHDLLKLRREEQGGRET